MTAKTAPKITLWEFFQQLGKTFMLPVALLSFCGIMLGIGSSLSSHDVLTLLPWLDMPLLQAIFIWMSKVGSFAFSFLPVMFCIAIPLGLARENKGVAAFAGFVGYAVMNLAVNFWLTAKGILPTTDAAILKANNIQNIIGIPSIDTGILGAVIAGIIVWLLHERFHNIRLPDALAFFGGTRFVPIVTTVVLGLVGLAIPLVWPVFAMGINALGKMINSAGDFGPMIFGTGERLLLPFGLHHIPVLLTRYAAQSLYAPARTVEAVPGIHPVNPHLPRRVSTLYPSEPLTVTPLAGWGVANRSVVALRLTNTGNRKVVLDPRALQGQFVSATFQHRWVGPAGTPEDTTTVYVVTAGRPESAFIAEPSALRKAARTVKQEARHAD